VVPHLYQAALKPVPTAGSVLANNCAQWFSIYRGLFLATGIKIKLAYERSMKILIVMISLSGCNSQLKFYYHFFVASFY
jgi:hypothetical protein